MVFHFYIFFLFSSGFHLPVEMSHFNFVLLRLEYISHAAKWLQSCPTLCDPIDGSPPGSLVPGILQARTLEWVAISFSNAWKWKVKVKLFSCVRLSATPWTIAHHAPPSMGPSRREHWSLVPLPSPILVIVVFKCLSEISKSWSFLSLIVLTALSLGGRDGLVAKLCATPVI